MAHFEEQQAVALRPVVGGVHTVQHENYRYGHGSLVVIVDEVIREVAFDNEPWWLVRVRWKSALSFGITPWFGPREIYLRAQTFECRED
jgi:hypothetical protein